MSISKATLQCRQILSQVRSDQTISPNRKVELENTFAKFKIWIENAGIFSSEYASLDHRLRDDSDISDVFVSILKSLKRSLEEAISPPPVHETQEEVRQAEISDSDSTGSSSIFSLDSEASEQRPENEPLGDINFDVPIQRAHNAIERLYRLYSIPSLPALPTKESEAKKFIADLKSPGDIEEMQDVEAHARNEIHTHFKEAPKFLVDRLVDAVVCRRMALRSKERNHERFLKVLLRQGSLVSGSWLIREKSTQSGEKRGLRQLQLNVRPPIELVEIPQTAMCPYCLQLIKEEEMQEPRWTRHVMGDISPYVCLFENCNEGHVLFKTPGEWLSHMQWQHTIVWSCQAQSHEQNIYSSQEGLEEHIRSAHPNSFTESQLVHIIEQSAQPAPDTFAALTRSFTSNSLSKILAHLCPICYNVRSRTEPNIHDHILEHLESIALLSLPEREDENTIEPKYSGGKGKESITPDITGVPLAFAYQVSSGKYIYTSEDEGLNGPFQKMIDHFLELTEAEQRSTIHSDMLLRRVLGLWNALYQNYYTKIKTQWNEIANISAMEHSDTGESYGNQLKASIDEAHKNVFQYLLRWSARINALDKSLDGALKGVRNAGKDNILQVLLNLSEGASVLNPLYSNMVLDAYGEILKTAAASGHGDMVHLLVKHDDDVDMQGRLYGDILQVAFGDTLEAAKRDKDGEYIHFLEQCNLEIQRIKSRPKRLIKSSGIKQFYELYSKK